MRISPAPTRLALVASLVALAGCDRAGASAELPAARGDAPIVSTLDLTTRPDILFQVFGERDDARMLPVAALVEGKILPITLDAVDWRQFDSLYTRSPAAVTLYQDGVRAGSAEVKRGMWEKDGEPLYTLPGCRQLLPHAAVTLGAGVRAGYSVEYLASTATIRAATQGASMPAAVTARAAREVAYGVGERASIPPSALDSLDFRAVAIFTGATPAPTLVASFIDRGAADGEAGDAIARHVFIVADKVGDRYASAFTHAVNAPASTAMYRRYVDHLDLTGDGIDEIVLEGWQAGGDTYLMVLGREGGKWSEVFRGRSSWCLDRKK